MTRSVVTLRERGDFSAVTTTLVASLFSFFACAPNDVVLADVPVAADAGDVKESACVDRTDCDERSFCAPPPGCGSPLGRCERLPVFCAGDFAPVCGCDGVTYWNDCVRRQRGVPVLGPGECTSAAARCLPGPAPEPSKCPEGAICAQLSPLGAPCGKDPLGVCWVLAEACVEQKAAPPVDSCDGSEVCTDLCIALRSGKAYRPSKPQSCGR